MAETWYAIRHALTRLGEYASHPLAYGAVLAYALLWLFLTGLPSIWNGVATLAVWFMTLLIQRTEHRDTQALQAKLDELLHAQSRADNALTKIDDQEPEEIVRHRDEARADD